MTLSRFYVAPIEEATFSGAEAKHCTQVLRKCVGDQVIVFDGAGTEATAEITTISSKRVELKILERRQTPAPAVSISLIQAIPKGANMEWIIEKAVELGVNAIFPVLTERTVVRLDAREAAKKQEKWQRVALEACKQCGQNWLPQVHAPAPFLSVLETLPAQDLKIIAALQPDSKSLKSILNEPGTKNQEPRNAVPRHRPRRRLHPRRICRGARGRFRAGHARPAGAAGGDRGLVRHERAAARTAGGHGFPTRF